MFNYIHWDPNPLIVDFGFVAIRWYSFFFMLAIVIGYEWMRRAFQQESLPESLFDRLSFWVILGGILGARLGHCLFYDFAYYSQHPLEIFLPFQWEPEFKITGFLGIASHGGAIGIVLVLIFFKYWYKERMPLWTILDHLALVIPLSGAFIRLGNLMNSEIIGQGSQLPWAFVFKQVDALPRHPSQLYEALAYLILFFGINAYVRHFQVKAGSGKRFGIFLVAMFVIRFVLEYFKEYQADFARTWIINMGQLLSIPFILGGLIIFIWALRRSVPAPQNQ
ncbi:MAG: prolipoprotein diacylglyceryl transferase [Bacteroidota bacterium]